MTHQELQAWSKRLGLSHPEAANALGLTVGTYRNLLYGTQPISQRTAYIADLIEERQHPQEKETTE